MTNENEANRRQPAVQAPVDARVRDDDLEPHAGLRYIARYRRRGPTADRTRANGVRLATVWTSCSERRTDRSQGDVPWQTHRKTRAPTSPSWSSIRHWMRYLACIRI